MKKALFIILALCLVLSLAACGGGGSTGTGTQTGNGIKSDHVHCVCAGKAVNVGEHTACSNKDGWLEVDTADKLADAIATSSAAKPAYVVLTADITIDSYLQVEQDQKAFICLGGKKLNASTTVIGELNITDCTGNGSVVGDKTFTIRTYAGAAVNLYAGTVSTTGSKTDVQIVTLDGGANEEMQLDEKESTFTIYGGKIQAVGKTTKSGHCVYIGALGILKMFDGTICDGYIETTETSGKYGGNVYVYAQGGEFYMFGGEVKNGTATLPGQVDSKAACGGNIYVYRGALYVSGGTISGGHTNGYGGNIGSGSSLATLDFKNCTITGGVAEGQNGGNIYFNGAGEQVTFDNVSITDGTSGTLGGNVFLNLAKVVTFKDCTISGGKITAPAAINKTGGCGITMQGKEFVVELKGNMKFENNQQSDIMTRYYNGTVSWLSVAELTTTSPITVAAAKKIELSLDTVANHPFVAIEGMVITEVDGKLVVDVAG